MEIHADTTFTPPRLIGYVVILDGEEVSDVTYASEEDGIVVRAQRDEQGVFQVLAGHYKVDVLNGAVQIRPIEGAVVNQPYQVVAPQWPSTEGPPAPPAE